MTQLEHPDRRGDGSTGPPYHLDLAFDGGSVLVHVAGGLSGEADDHVAEVARAARRCGLRVVVREAPDSSPSGGLV